MLEDSKVPFWPLDYAEKYRRCCWENKVMIDHVADASEKHGGEKVILRSAETGEALTYRALLDGSKRLAAHFLKIGFKPKDVVLLQLNNVPLFWQVWFALSRINVVPVDVVPRHRVQELSIWGTITGAVGYIMPGTFRGHDYFSMARDLKSRVPSIEYVLTGSIEEREGVINLRRLLNEPPSPELVKRVDEIKVSPDDVDVLLLTGGTTGLPKLVPRTHASHAYNIKLVTKYFPLSPNTRLLVPLPIEYNFVFSMSLANILKGGITFMSDTHRGEELMELIDKWKITVLVCVPTLLTRILDSPERGRYNLDSLQIVIAGGQVTPPVIAERLEREIGCKFLNAYGMAEGLWMVTTLNDPEEVRWRAMGKPISEFDEVKVVNSETAEEITQPGIRGELWVRGPYTVRGYYGDPEKTKENFTPDGYYKTGDLVYRDEKGYFYFVSRIKDIINRGGEKIGCEEVESYIMQHPKVKEVGVVGMPDPELGEKVCAYVVLKSDKDKLSLKELREFLEKLGVAWYKHPERLEIVNSLPLTGREKVDRRALREDIEQKLKAERLKGYA